MKHVSPTHLILGFVTGVAIQSVTHLGIVFSLFLFLLGCILLLLPRTVTSVTFSRVSVPFILIAVALGCVRFDVAQFYNQPAVYLTERVNTEVLLEGVIIEEPDERESHVKLTVEVALWELMTDRDKILVLAPLYPSIHYGDRVQINGQLEVPENFISEDTGRIFNYEMFLAKNGIHFMMAFPDIEVLEGGQGSRVKGSLFAMKSAFLTSIGKTIHEPYAALLGGLVVGAKRSLGEDVLDMFRVTGLIHIVVLSGYNVTIVAESLMRFFSFLPRVATVTLGGGSIILFAIMTGASATVVRASIMALLIVVGRAMGRSADLPRLLILALFLMVMHNPYIVIYDPSFQLSFIAMLGLLYGAPLLEERFTRIPTFYGLRSVAAATLATQVAVLPLLLYMMGNISIVALPVNLLVLIFIPVTMLFGFITGVVGMANPSLATPVAFITFVLLYYEIGIVRLFASIPHASVTVKHFPLWLMILFYLLYIFLYYYFVKQKTGRCPV